MRLTADHVTSSADMLKIECDLYSRVFRVVYTVEFTPSVVTSILKTSYNCTSAWVFVLPFSCSAV